jgi:hypothetical protein
LGVKHGYKPVEVHEVCEYQVTRYDPQSGDGDLFAEYFNTLLKLKSEASGYPNWVQCPENEDQNIGEFQE